MDVRFDLEDDMSSDQGIIALLADKEIAKDFYRALCNMQWEKIEALPEDERIINRLKGIRPEVWSCTWRSAGSIVASIRGKHHATCEDYMDFYCSGNESYVSELVSENFSRLGWKQRPWLTEL